MALKLFVRGEIQYGRFHEFQDALLRYNDYRRQKGWVVPAAMTALSGPMNSVVLIYEYDDAGRLDAEELAAGVDAEYVRMAGALAFREPTIVYELLRDL